MKKIILRINGAAGNQFFQYAFARSIQEKVGGDLYIDYGMVKHNDTLWAGSDNLLKDFNTVPYEYCEAEPKKGFFLHTCLIRLQQLRKIDTFDPRAYKMYKRIAKHLEKFGFYFWCCCYYPFKYKYLKNVDTIKIQGYFECPKFFEDINDKILEELTPKHPLLEQNVELYKAITEKPSVCITIKRMDIENPDISDVYEYDISYFYNAVKYIREKEPNAVFVIFSDNVEWCKENFHIDGEVYYETPNNPIWEKIRLMSGCKHFIIHNSTFSWWVQHLGHRDGKIVIAPVKWMLRDDEPIEIYEDNWIYMRNDGTIQETHD